MMNIPSADLSISLLQKNKYDQVSKGMGKDDVALKAACDNFESFFMQQMLDVSFKSSNIAGEQTGSKIIKGMYTENMAKASAGTMGISDMLFKFLSEQKQGK